MSSLQTVLAALNREEQGERDANAASGENLSFTLVPLWNGPSGKPHAQEQNGDVVTDISLERVAFSCHSLATKIKGEEYFISKISSSDNKPGKILRLLKTHLQGIPSYSVMNKDYVGYYKAVCDAVIEDHMLRKLIESSCGALSRRLIVEILRWCIKFKCWDLVCTFLGCGVVSGNELPELIDSLVEAGNIPLVCLCILRVHDIRPGQWLRILQLFLRGNIEKDAFLKSFNLNRRIWRSVVISYIEQTAKMQKKDEFIVRRREDLEARRAACVKLAAAFDGFAAWELCMHIFLGAGHDEAVLGAILSELDGDEVISALRYLNKWLEKHDSQLAHKGQMGRDERKLLPSAHMVIRWIEFLLEGRYASIVLGKGVSDEVETTQRFVSGLVAGGRKIGHLEGVLQHLLTESPLPSEKLAVSEHIIEYLEIS